MVPPAAQHGAAAAPRAGAAARPGDDQAAAAERVRAAAAEDMAAAGAGMAAHPPGHGVGAGAIDHAQFQAAVAAAAAGQQAAGLRRRRGWRGAMMGGGHDAGAAAAGAGLPWMVGMEGGWPVMAAHYPQVGRQLGGLPCCGVASEQMHG